jgi:hypothetical protein
MLDVQVSDCLGCVLEGKVWSTTRMTDPDWTSAASSAKFCVLGCGVGMTSRTRDARAINWARIIKPSGPMNRP